MAKIHSAEFVFEDKDYEVIRVRFGGWAITISDATDRELAVAENPWQGRSKERETLTNRQYKPRVTDARSLVNDFKNKDGIFKIGLFKGE